MNKLTFFKISSAVFLLVNLVLLGFMAMGKKAPPGPKKMIIERLGLDEGQQEAFHVLISEHRVAIRDKEGEIRGLKEQLYQGLAGDSAKENQEAIIGKLGQIQMEIEQIHLAHFEGIKSLCRSDQIPAFNDFTKEMARLFSGKKMKKRNGKK